MPGEIVGEILVVSRAAWDAVVDLACRADELNNRLPIELQSRELDDAITRLASFARKEPDATLRDQS